MPESLAVVMPIYNEGENILATLDSLHEKVKSSIKVYLVYDFEADNTLPIIKAHYQNYPNLNLVKNKYGRGVLNAIKTGLEEAKEPFVLVSMADGSDDYRIVDEMLDKAQQGYAVVCASRYMKGGQQLGGPFLKTMLSRLAGVSAFYLTGIPTHDITNSYRMYSKALLDQIKIESQGGFEIGLEITVKAYLKGLKICEIPTIWRDREAGKSNFKLAQWLPRYLHWYGCLLAGKWLGLKA